MHIDKSKNQTFDSVEVSTSLDVPGALNLGAGSMDKLINTATTLYVDPAGNDTTGDGSIGSPWATLSKALSYLADKTITALVTINLNAGTYTHNSTTTIEHPDGSFIRIIGAGPTTILDAGVSNIDVLSVASDLYSLGGFLIQWDAQAINRIGVRVINGSKMRSIASVDLTNAYYAILLEGGSNVGKISTCDFTTCHRGVTALDRSKAQVQSCTITSAFLGIETGSLGFIYSNTNTFDSCTEAMRATDGGRIVSDISSETFTGNTTDQNPALSTTSIIYGEGGSVIFDRDSAPEAGYLLDAVLPKTSGVGIRVDQTTPSFPWRDIVGYPTIRGNVSVDPLWSVYRGNIRQSEMDLTTKALTFVFHVPHDWVPGSDLFIHVHWSHILNNVTSGAVTWQFETTYAKGHDQEAFVAPVSPTVTQNAVTGASGQYRHMIAEVQLTAASPSASQIDTDLVEVDGLFLVRINWTSNTISPSTNPFIHTADLHYQSSNIGTKQKVPNFYV